MDALNLAILPQPACLKEKSVKHKHRSKPMSIANLNTKTTIIGLTIGAGSGGS